jgi:hypothetical protein
MVQRRSSTSLTAKAFKSLRIFGKVIGQKFQSNEAAKLEVLRLEDHTHATATELLQDVVVGDGLAD